MQLEKMKRKKRAKINKFTNDSMNWLFDVEINDYLQCDYMY